jgi:hypothetical protein
MIFYLDQNFCKPRHPKNFVHTFMEDGDIYHITLLRNLDSIMRSGLGGRIGWGIDTSEGDFIPRFTYFTRGDPLDLIVEPDDEDDELARLACDVVVCLSRKRNYTFVILKIDEESRDLLRERGYHFEEDEEGVVRVPRVVDGELKPIPITYIEHYATVDVITCSTARQRNSARRAGYSRSCDLADGSTVFIKILAPEQLE